MKVRCLNKKNAAYPLYGGRGIKLCNSWMVFDNFLKDMGECPEGMQIDRIDNDGDYEPSNCRWTTAKEQARNRRSSLLLSINGKTQPAAKWAEENGIPKATLYCRIANGWPAARAIFEPLHLEKRNKRCLTKI